MINTSHCNPSVAARMQCLQQIPHLTVSMSLSVLKLTWLLETKSVRNNLSDMNPLSSTVYKNTFMNNNDVFYSCWNKKNFRILLWYQTIIASLCTCILLLFQLVEIFLFLFFTRTTTDFMASSTQTIPDVISSQPPNTVQAMHMLNHPLPVKLDKNNYILWCTQMENVIFANSCEERIEGLKACPPKTTTTGEINPEFLKWRRYDCRIPSWIYSSLTPEIMGQIIGHQTSHAAWTAPEKIFLSLPRQQKRFIWPFKQKSTKIFFSSTRPIETIKNIYCRIKWSLILLPGCTNNTNWQKLKSF